MDKTKIFLEGVTFTKREGSPAFVLGQIGININQLNNFIEKNPNLVSEKGWLNIDALLSQNTNKPYTVVSTWTPKVVDKELEQLQQQVMNREPVIEMGETSQGYDGETISPEDIPF